ncbi:MAG: VanW family protein [Ignavibacteriae bacterium]|nr:VanW family protein [Ignavibacteriota bacterium]
MNYQQVVKPKERNYLRQHLGKEYFILRRRLRYLFGNITFAQVDKGISLRHSIIKHKSFILRPLKGVDMYLQYNKVTNLKLAVKQVDKVLIKPGETLSVWRLLGRPTKFKGYLDGLQLHNGKISKNIGGGLCQLSNLLYWMVLHTPLTITERWRHGFDVFPDLDRTIPFGCGSTLAYNYIDLQIQNNTDKTFHINLWLDEKYLNGEITCDVELKLKYDVFETDHCIKQQFWGGYTRHNKIWKRITNIVDNTVTDEFVTDNNAIMMYNPLLDK